MSGERLPTEFDDALDSAIIRLNVLQRSQMTSQDAAASLDAPADVSVGRSIRVDPKQREVLLHPFTDGVG